MSIAYGETLVRVRHLTPTEPLRLLEELAVLGWQPVYLQLPGLETLVLDDLKAGI